jgi:hypothetical protein
MPYLKKVSRHIDQFKKHSLRLVIPPEQRLTQLDWNLLVRRIREKECTVFVGAGANSGILATGDDIARKWGTDYQYPFEEYELSKVAQFMAVEVWGDVFIKQELISQFLAKSTGSDLDKRISASPLGLLARLPIPIYLTTNYDDFMFRALELEGKKPRREVCAWNYAVQKARDALTGDSRNKFDAKFGPFLSGTPRFDPTPSNPIVFHLHGHHLIPGSLVLTEDDYYDFLVRWASPPAMIPPQIQAALSTTSLLFVGYRLADLSFGVVFRSTFSRMPVEERLLNIAVQLPPGGNPLALKYLNDYFQGKKIKVYWGKASEFTKELSQHYRSKSR